MHPQLNAEHQHEGCVDLMRALKDCHSENSIMRYLGTCNDAKEALNRCFRQERLERTTKNRQDAKEKRRLVEEKWKAIEAES
ncbi:UPF0287-domain-containing protein [Meredithblackwellia eburnea MCA 4105]